MMKKAFPCRFTLLANNIILVVSEATCFSGVLGELILLHPLKIDIKVWKFSETKFSSTTVGLPLCKERNWCPILVGPGFPFPSKLLSMISILALNILVGSVYIIHQQSLWINYLCVFYETIHRSSQQMTIPWAQPPGGWGVQIQIQIWQYIPIYLAILPIIALLSDTL